MGTDIPCALCRRLHDGAWHGARPHLHRVRQSTRRECRRLCRPRAVLVGLPLEVCGHAGLQPSHEGRLQVCHVRRPHHLVRSGAPPLAGAGPKGVPRRQKRHELPPTFIDLQSPTASGDPNYGVIGQHPYLFWVSIGDNPEDIGRHLLATPFSFAKGGD